MAKRSWNTSGIGLAMFLGAVAAPALAPLSSTLLPPAAAQREGVPPPSRAAVQYSFAPIVK